MQRNHDEERLIESAEQDDEQILGGDEGSFVPAFRPHGPDYDMEDERCLLERPEDEVVLVSNEPETGKLYTYVVFYLLGIGTMTPWNFFVTAEDYWKYKFRNTTLNGTDPDEELTPLQKSFTCDLALTATIAGTTFLLLNAIYGNRISLRVKMLSTLSCILVLFGVTTGFVEVNTDAWQEQFFLITLIIVVLLNSAAATMSGALYGIAGLFPSEFITAVVSGQALGGILTALAFILVLAFDTGPNTTAFIFFIVGSVLILLCIVCYKILVRKPFFKYYLEGGDKYKVISAIPSHSRNEETEGVTLEPIMRKVMTKIYLHAVCLALLYTTTLSVYPAVTVLMQSEHSASHTEWTDVYYLPVVNYLIFNCGDYFGRLLAGWLERPINQNTSLLLIVLRMIFVPFFLFSNTSEHIFLPTLVEHDYTFIAMMCVFALSNGYLTNILLIMAPRSVKQHEKELASSIMAAALSVGMAVGSLLSLCFVQML
ncbi:equilibrative nucleoside transporter 3 [Drosophila guanche]|uniref:Blast:Equilibrative nucleoside transporter 3 n=1 Tax=Drosophila guanche TaxID=7266 RepID=A0A3B0JHD0_DROGU|nr:equilibrative nucleoside transporter 3 [Drosophila guanche]SPP79692.1 blast:Equilibrative nucleoside transporter 3 [Drosophila guanche]